MPEKHQSFEIKKSDYVEITFNDIISFFKKYYIVLAFVTFVSTSLGYAGSFLMTKMYHSETILLPEQGPTSGGGFLASLAGLGGVSAIEKIGAVRTDLYPNVMKSMPFALFMLKQPVKDINNKDYKSLEEYFSEKPKTSFFGLFPASPAVIAPPIPKLPNNEILTLSILEEQKAKSILGLISTNIDQKTGIITIESETNDPIVAAMAVSAASKYLLNYVEDYRTGKTAREVVFLGKRMSEAKQREMRAEYALQSYRDRNRNAFLNVARIEEQRLQSDYTLAQSLYADLARKYEQAAVKVKEDQPIFKVLEPAKVSLQTSKPRRLLVALSSGFIGFIISLAYILIKKPKTEIAN
ncbi:GNVR domain-containing protein [Dyadobacter frigoris]|uniref:Lipopolysaccharide biosynthesis protein n=1 Tax=Dyadobacter frigoris TaxID=2576211 RepID=A0A4U6D7C4_9BACT|nr:GNVR domain-containing protein [Dyadobacter frigoris]TKT93282.1 lipopolysaccharide biosynthesis protein [Dyadobacter frigoris]